MVDLFVQIKTLWIDKRECSWMWSSSSQWTYSRDWRLRIYLCQL